MCSQRARALSWCNYKFASLPPTPLNATKHTCLICRTRKRSSTRKKSRRLERECDVYFIFILPHARIYFCLLFFFSRHESRQKPRRLRAHLTRACILGYWWGWSCRLARAWNASRHFYTTRAHVTLHPVYFSLEFFFLRSLLLLLLLPFFIIIIISTWCSFC